jgi:hypothetical protein
MTIALDVELDLELEVKAQTKDRTQCDEKCEQGVGIEGENSANTIIRSRSDLPRLSPITITTTVRSRRMSESRWKICLPKTSLPNFSPRAHQEGSETIRKLALAVLGDGHNYGMRPIARGPVEVRE